MVQEGISSFAIDLFALSKLKENNIQNTQNTNREINEALGRLSAAVNLENEDTTNSQHISSGPETKSVFYDLTWIASLAAA